MKKVYSFIIAFLSIIFLIGCTHSSLVDGNDSINPPPPPEPPVVLKECSKDTVFFVQTVLPLVTALCGNAGCHIRSNYSDFYIIYDNGTQSENEINSYNAIKSRFSSVSNLENNITKMINQNQSGFVPPDEAQLTLLKTWINQGLKQNSCTDCNPQNFKYAENIKPILSTYCVGCHNSTSAAAGVNLSTYDDVVNEITTNPDRLVASIEWTGAYTGNKAMPYNSGKLPDCYIEQIKNWVAAGAPND